MKFDDIVVNETVSEIRLRSMYGKDFDALSKLLNEWDFIGVSPFDDGPTDEYYCLIEPIMILLARDISTTDLAQFLSLQTKEHGLPTAAMLLQPIAKRVIEWYSKRPFIESNHAH